MIYDLVLVCVLDIKLIQENQHVKRIIKYVYGTSYYGGNFTTNITCEISSYIDAYWVGN